MGLFFSKIWSLVLLCLNSVRLVSSVPDFLNVPFSKSPLIPCNPVSLVQHHLQTCWGYPFCQHLYYWWSWAGWNLMGLLSIATLTLNVCSYPVNFILDEVWCISYVSNMFKLLRPQGNCSALQQHVGLLCLGCYFYWTWWTWIKSVHLEIKWQGIYSTIYAQVHVENKQIFSSM